MSNQIDQFVIENCPQLQSVSEGPAQYELHIFLSPINPSDIIVQRYYKAVDDWNATNSEYWAQSWGCFQMKACLLCLVFREEHTFAEKPVYVMQSSIYMKSRDLSQVIEQSHRQAEYFNALGLPVIREKIEVMVYGTSGIPQNKSQLVKYNNTDVPDLYFEFHIKCRIAGKSDRTVDQSDIELLRACSNRIAAQYGAPCPLSYNINPHQFQTDYAGNQRFLNVRFRDIGITEIDLELRKITEILAQHGVEKDKTISELVVYDTNSGLDARWIDFAPDEKESFIRYLQQKNLTI